VETHVTCHDSSREAEVERKEGTQAKAGAGQLVYCCWDRQRFTRAFQRNMVEGIWPIWRWNCLMVEQAAGMDVRGVARQDFTEQLIYNSLFRRLSVLSGQDVLLPAGLQEVTVRNHSWAVGRGPGKRQETHEKIRAIGDKLEEKPGKERRKSTGRSASGRLKELAAGDGRLCLQGSKGETHASSASCLTENMFHSSARAHGCSCTYRGLERKDMPEDSL
jgi:hypothetical protein